MGFKRVFQIERNGRRRKFTLQSRVIESFLSVHDSNVSVEISLSDKKSICTVLQIQLSDETLIGLRRPKEYGCQNNGTHNIYTLDKQMLSSVQQAHLMYDQSKHEDKMEKLKPRKQEVV